VRNGPRLYSVKLVLSGTIKSVYRPDDLEIRLTYMYRWSCGLDFCFDAMVQL
jgi:hypothetical protein